jgi:hypothetical protein
MSGHASDDMKMLYLMWMIIRNKQVGFFLENYMPFIGPAIDHMHREFMGG